MTNEQYTERAIRMEQTRKAIKSIHEQAAELARQNGQS